MGGRRKSFYLPDRIESGRIECMPGREVAELRGIKDLSWFGWVFKERWQLRRSAIKGYGRVCDRYGRDRQRHIGRRLS